MKRMFVLALVTVLGALTAQPATAQSYPSRTATIVVPFPAGGSVDGVARILVQKLNQIPGWSFIVENRAGGAGGTVGANTVAKAAPDGYTLLLTASINAINPFLFKNLPYDFMQDFTPISLLAIGPLLVSTAPNVPAKNLTELFDLVRKDPTKFTFGHSGVGSASHLAAELLKREAKLDALIIAYKGTAPVLTDLMSGTIQLFADPMLSSLPLAQAGRIKALAITSRTRVVAAPEVPTVEESSGIKGFELVSWYGVWGPRGLPPEIVTRLNVEIAGIIKQPEVQQRLLAIGFEPVGSSAAEFSKYIASEMAKYEKIIKEANIKAD
jgi:tripartite-type tricarboxylate transporter receptor subunit TctC